MPQGQIEDIKKNTGTAVPTEVSAQEVNPMQQPNINVNQQEVKAVAQWTSQPQAVQQANTTVQQSTTQPQDLKFTELNWWLAAQQWVAAMTGAIDYSNIKNSDAVLSQLVQWQPVDWIGIAVDNARERYNDYKSLSWMSYKEIWDTILSGDMAKNWTSMSDLRTYNPQLWETVRLYVTQQEELNNLNKLWNSLYQNYTNVEDNKNYLKQTIQQEDENTKSIITTYSDDIIDFIKSYQTNATQLMNLASSMLNNPTIQQYKNNILALEWKIAQIQTDIEYVWDEARQMLWSSAPESLVSAYISQQTKALQRQLMTYNNSLLVEQGKLDSAVDDVKTKLDYYMKWMDLWTDALKALMWGSTGSSSSSKSTSWNTSTEDLTKWTTTENVSKIKDAIVDWSFWWKFTVDALKEYWLKNTDETTILKNVAKTLTQDDLDKILANSSKSNFKKIMKYFVEEQEAWIVEMLKGISNMEDASRWFNAYLIAESVWKDLMNKAWYTTKQINEVAANLWWKELEWEKATDMKQSEVKTQEAQDIINKLTIWKKDWIIPSNYAEQINKATGAKKKVTSKWEEAYNALMNWTFNKDKTTYWFAKNDWRNYVGSQIWGNCSSVNDYISVINKLNSEFDWEEQALKNISEWVRDWYKSQNWNIWVKAVQSIDSKSKSSTEVWNLKMYLQWILWWESETLKKQLLKEAWVSADIIKKVL